MSDSYDGSDYERALNDLKKKLELDIHSLHQKKDLYVLIEGLKANERIRKRESQ